MFGIYYKNKALRIIILLTRIRVVFIMTRSIHIPDVKRDERIGSVFNYLFKITNATENADADVEWDFSVSSFFHPFLLAPLAIFKHRSEKGISCIIPSYLSKYFDLICFNDLLELTNDENLEGNLDVYAGKTYTPICKFQLGDEKATDAIQSVLQRIIRRQTKYDSEIHTPLSYMLGEIICNISQHSHGKYGYIYSQYLKSEKCINICIADDGITIYGSYVKSCKYLDKIEGNEAKALELANNGYSTKDIPERGFGLPTTRKMLVEGLNGSFFELSGGAFYRYERGAENYVILPKTIFWDGTIILMKYLSMLRMDLIIKNI